MNIVSSILNRELATDTAGLKILWLDPSPSAFVLFVEKLGCRSLTINDLYYGSQVPELIICNNKVTHYEECRALSIGLHTPSIVIDHIAKNYLLDNEKIKFLDNLPSAYKIAINNKISTSWGSIHDKVLNYDIDNNTSIEAWKAIIMQNTKRIFNI